ncbi:hypothetical protein DY000_02009400 [Brassica cretica]|uniref:Protein kinase domain-containing protein n=1 Tax=Brassica cretica TaxID=69181 RepID=A0ABQ7CFQ9_BRACR|nr:hypothetical protein DY000_02009400 [Brassica cretica]
MRHMPEHPNVVTLKDTYEDEHAVHLVMELCEGVELFDRIVARGHYTERAAAVVTKTIMAVVQMNDKQLEVKKEVVVDVKQYSGVELIIKISPLNLYAAVRKWKLWVHAMDELGRFVSNKRGLTSLKMEGCSNLGRIFPYFNFNKPLHSLAFRSSFSLEDGN